MAKGKSVFSRFSCKECKMPRKRLVPHSSKTELKEMNKFCARCRKYTIHKPKIVKKPVKK